MAVTITDEMREAALRESRKRDPNISHHFDLEYMTGEERDQIGFLGEFACKACLGLDWRKGTRENYDTADHGDILLPKAAIDIKTETIPYQTLARLIRGRIRDDQPYGRRLITERQIPLLEHYGYIVWGAFPRGSDRVWYSLGYLESACILGHYSVTTDTPFGGKYPVPCLSIPHSRLKNIQGLARIIANP